MYNTRYTWDTEIQFRTLEVAIHIRFCFLRYRMKYIAPWMFQIWSNALCISIKTGSDWADNRRIHRAAMSYPARASDPHPWAVPRASAAVAFVLPSTGSSERRPSVAVAAAGTWGWTAAGFDLVVVDLEDNPHIDPDCPDLGSSVAVVGGSSASLD